MTDFDEHYYRSILPGFPDEYYNIFVRYSNGERPVEVEEVEQVETNPEKKECENDKKTDS